MVRLYIWKPTKASEVLGEGLMPDFGHAAMEVVDEATGRATYMSFWPELESLVGVATRPWKRREKRNPSTYEEESDPEAGFMQRPADAIETLHGLNEARILREWQRLQDSEFHVRSWNCSNVSKYLLIRSMPPEDYARIADAASCTMEDMNQIRADDELQEVLRHLASASFIDCRPEDVLRMVIAYNERVAKEADEALAHAETVTLPAVPASNPV
jgi:hypothetical protein